MVLLILLEFTIFFQQVTFKRSIYDALAKRSLPKALIFLSKHTTTSLVNLMRINSEGLFEFRNMSLDAYKVMISHP